MSSLERNVYAKLNPINNGKNDPSFEFGIQSIQKDNHIASNDRSMFDSYYYQVIF